MTIVISHSSAFDFLRPRDASLTTRPRPSSVRTSGSLITDDDALLFCEEYDLSPPLHVLISRDKKRPNSRHVVFHTRSEPLPKRSLLRVNDDALVASPELVFFQTTARMKRSLAINVGYELCGSYSSREFDDPRYEDTRFDRAPLTSIAKLNAFADRAAGLHGIEQARRSLRYMLPKSASPMETILAMSLVLPRMQGGCHLSNPQLNFSIIPRTKQRGPVGKDCFKCDLYWEKAKLAVEYDSDLYHTGANRIARDSRRRGELSALGVTVITVTSNQVFNFNEFNKVANAIAKQLGERMPKRDKRFTEAQLKLRAELFSTLKRSNPSPSDH